jgi:hypothetical protein
MNRRWRVGYSQWDIRVWRVRRRLVKVWAASAIILSGEDDSFGVWGMDGFWGSVVAGMGG